LSSIFDPFVQVDASHNRTAEGTGLGLAISRELARGMGGDLVVDSAVGVGSTFTLTLSLVVPAQPPSKPELNAEVSEMAR
jgi:signal transduction histidine kinase